VCLVGVITEVPDRLRGDADDSAGRHVVHLARERNLSAVHRDEHFLLSLVGVGGRHLAGVDDHLVHPEFGRSERFG